MFFNFFFFFSLSLFHFSLFFFSFFLVRPLLRLNSAISPFPSFVCSYRSMELEAAAAMEVGWLDVVPIEDAEVETVDVKSEAAGMVVRGSGRWPWKPAWLKVAS
ncbi:unnamed protein product [Cuscuta epithymum]|uniref:Secreted protein n=1 Tax=Cuscuta epithymum TaxID=186058 RepID=A0AAV0CU97_9ASTE|nr:unnamed protein product [Cuscuta epithymum]